MGQAQKRPGAAAQGDVADAPRTAASLVDRFKNAQKETTQDIPLIGEIRLRPLLRAVHESLPITEDSDPEEDQLHIIAATVVDPELTADEWRQLRDAAPLGTWGTIVQAVWSANGLTPNFVKEQGARFRT